MIVATYNIWNSPSTNEQRFEALCEEIASLDADVIMMQEVAAAPAGDLQQHMAARIAARAGFPYVSYRPYPDPESSDEGLAICSKHPFEQELFIWKHERYGADCAQRVLLRIGSARIGITNVHLDWKHVGTRERQIGAVHSWIESQAEQGVAELLCGDFNDVPDSSIHRFLQGRQSLHGQATRWVDLASYAEWQTGEPFGATLDFAHNPRWQHTHTLQIPARVDWMLVRQDPSRREAEPIVHQVRRFGINPTPQAQLVPSDHYGVAAQLEWTKR